MPLVINPIQEAIPLLIYGGSTAIIRTLAIQFAKLSGYTVLTTCSLHNFGIVREVGADMIFDYTDPKSSWEIRKATNNNKLQLVLTASHGPPTLSFAAMLF